MKAHDLHASSLHEPFLEPLRQMVPDKHSVNTHLPKNGNCKICQRTKITRASCRRRTGGAVPRAKNVEDLITAKFSVKDVNLETIIDMQLWCKTELLDSIIAVYNKNFAGTRKVLQKPSRKPKVIYTDNSIEFGKACEDLSWNHCTLTPHRSETNGLAERAAR